MQATTWRACLVAAATCLVLCSAAAPLSAQQAGSDDEPDVTNQPDPTLDQPMDLPPPPPSWLNATSPQLTCGVRRTGSAAFAAGGATITCWVAGAPGDDTTFVVRASRIVSADAGTSRPIGQICGSGALVDGSGVCSGLLAPRSGPAFGGLLMEATLQPSGTILGPVHIAPTLTGA